MLCFLKGILIQYCFSLAQSPVTLNAFSAFVVKLSLVLLRNELYHNLFTRQHNILKFSLKETLMRMSKFRLLGKPLL